MKVYLCKWNGRFPACIKGTREAAERFVEKYGGHIREFFVDFS